MTPSGVEAARRATSADLGALERLVALARTEVEPLRGGAAHLAHELRPAEDDLRARLEDPEQLVLVGTFDDVVVGHLVATLAPSHDGSRPIVRVLDLFVEEAGRGVAVGDALLLGALAWAEEVDAAGVDAYALPGARETKNFFEAHGFTARLLVVHRRR